MKIFQNNSKRITKILMTIKLSVASISASAYAMGNEKFSFWLLVSTGVLDIIVSALSSEEQA